MGERARTGGRVQGEQLVRLVCSAMAAADGLCDVTGWHKMAVLGSW